MNNLSIHEITGVEVEDYHDGKDPEFARLKIKSNGLEIAIFFEDLLKIQDFAVEILEAEIQKRFESLVDKNTDTK